MENDAYSSALRETLNDIAETCPEIYSIFLFKGGNVISREEKTQEEIATRTVATLDEVLKKAESIDDVQSINIEGTYRTLNVSRVGDFYLVTVASQSADSKYVDTLTRLPLQTVLKMLERMGSPAEKDKPSEIGNEESTSEPNTKLPLASIEDSSESREERITSTADPERILPEPQVNQFMVENVRGLFASSDTVRIDDETLSQWTELYDGMQPKEVTIETFGGKSAQCKLKPIKDSKYEYKGIIQIPEKIQQTLEIKKGELIRVKPVIE